MQPLPSPQSIPSLPTEARAAILDLLFEPSVPLHTLSVALLHETTFESYNDLIASIGVQLTDLSESTSTSDTEWLDKILGAHPRLGEKKVDSEQSRREQAQLNAASGGSSVDDAAKAAQESEKLASLNQEYEKAFPGLRYVVFVNGRSRPVIMEDMEKRIARRDIKAERADAIKAMCEIAADRAAKIGTTN